MSKFPLSLPPGIVSDDTRLAAKGRWADGSNVRFWEGLPEVIGGWESIVPTLLTGVCRTAFQWTDRTYGLNIGLGTHSALQVWVGGNLYDVTPTKALPPRTLTANPLTVQSGSYNVTVYMPGHGFAGGDSVTISGVVAVGGITPNGTFSVSYTVDSDNFVIVNPSPGTSNAVGGGSAVVVTPNKAFTAGQIDGTGGNAGFGTGAWDVGTFGTPSLTDYFPRTWSLAAWGDNLLGVPRAGTLYQWANNTGTPAQPVANAPAKIKAMVVSHTDQVFALGCNQEANGVWNPLCLRHSGIRNLTEWNTSTSTTAREYILTGGGEIVAGRRMGKYLLIWTTNALFVGTFTGNLAQPWTFEPVGEKCGLIGPNACVVVGQKAFWLSPDLQFRAYSLGGEPVIMDCPIRKDMADNITASQSDKIVASSLSKFGEVRWDYPDARDGFENSRYVAVSILTGTWYRGQMARTAMVDAGPSESPIGVTYAGNLYWHERGHSADGAPMSWAIETADLYIDEEYTVLVRGIWADIKDQIGPWLLTVYSRLKPQGDPRTFGPVAIAVSDDKTDLRCSGRLVRLRFEGSASPTGGRIGLPIIDYKESSQR